MASLFQRLKTSRQTWRRAHYASLATLAVLSACVGIVVQQTSLGQRIDLRVFSFILSQRPLPAHPDLRLVTFQKSTDQRKQMAELIDALRKAEAKVLLFNVKFELDAPAGRDPDLDLIRQAVRRAADSEMWIVVPRGQVQTAAALGDKIHDSNRYEFEPTPFESESWKSRLNAHRDPGHLLIGATIGIPSTNPVGVLLHVNDLKRNEELLDVAGFTTAAALASDSTDPGLGEIYQYEAEGIVRLAGVLWRVLPHQLVYLRPVDSKGIYSADVTQVLADPSPFRNKIVVFGGDFGPAVQSDILGEVSAPAFTAAMVNTLLHDAVLENKSTPPDRGLEVHPVCVIGTTLVLSLLAAFGSLGRLPIRKTISHPLASLVLSVAVIFLALGLSVYVPILSFDQAGQYFPPSPLLVSVSLSSVIGWIAAAKFSRGFEMADLPDRFDGQATVLFVDLKSSTPLVVKVGAEEAPKILGTFLRHCTDAITVNQGRVERTLGDGVLAVFFGPPVGGIDHAERALRAMQLIAASTASLIADVASRYGAETGFTAGIESGPLAMEYSREPGGWAWQSFGPTVHLAKRLQESSSNIGHAVVVGPESQRLASERGFDLVSIGPISAKGFEGQIVASALQFPESSGKVTDSASLE